MTWLDEGRDYDRQLLDLLFRLNQQVLRNTPLQYILGEVAATAHRLTGADSTSLMLLDRPSGKLEIAAAAGLTPREAEEIAFHRGEGIAGWVAEHKETLSVPDTSQDDRFKALDGQPTPQASVISAPLVDPTGVTGVLTVGAPQPNHFDAATVAFVDRLAREVGRDLHGAMTYKDAVTDPLTGAFNRAYLAERLDWELARHRRYAMPLSLVLFDVDHLEETNETHGREGGDQILEELVRRLHQLLRDVDCLVRYGAGMFLLILPNTPLDGAHLLAERLRTRVVIKPYTLADLEVIMSISAGVVALREGDTAPTDLIARADQALFHAKDQGRNRVVVSGWALTPF